MKRAIYTDIEFDVPPERVWQKLANLDHYSSWNTLFQIVGGSIKENGSIQIRLTAPGVWALVFGGRITRFEPYGELRWRFFLGIPGLLDGVHSFTIQPINNNGSLLIQKMRFKGMFGSAFVKKFHYNLARGMESMNMSLKDLAETEAESSES